MIEFRDPADVDMVRYHLRYGQKHAVTQKQLAALTLLPLRRVQAALEEAKRGGEPICTGDAGVWLSNDPGELRAMYRRDRNRAIRQLVNNRGRLKAIDNLLRYHQDTLWGGSAGAG